MQFQPNETTKPHRSLDDLDLSSFLDQAQHAETLFEKLTWLTDLLSWAQGARPEWQADLLEAALRRADKKPATRAAVARLIATVIKERSLVQLFVQTGIPQGSTPWAEALRRGKALFLGRPFENCDLSDWLALVFESPRDLGWLRTRPETLIEGVIALLKKEGVWDTELEDTLRLNLMNALLELGQQAAADVRLAGLSTSLKELSMDPHPIERCVSEIADCRAKLSGTAEISYPTERMLLILDRLEILLHTLSGRSEEPSSERISRILLPIAQAVVTERDFETPLKRALSEMARNIAEETATRGERFVARTRSQYLGLLAAGSGGGLVTCLTVVGKYLIFWLRIPAFLGGALISLNYAAGFLLIHAFHFRLVTKQPAIAAAALARVLESHAATSRKSLRKPLLYLAAISRSIVATAVSNLALVSASVIGFDLVYRALNQGRSFLDAQTSHHMIESLNPFSSLTLPCAALTGAMLWLSSVIGGWFEKRAGNPAKPGKVFGVASSISLGALFGTVPVLGAILHLALDVRHMTLSSGALVMAVCSLGIQGSLQAGLLPAFLGILSVTALNLGVSFGLGLLVSIHARGLDRSILVRLAGAIREGWREFRNGTRQIDWRSLLLPPTEDWSPADQG